MPIDTHQPRADALVLFDTTGDLAEHKLLPARHRNIHSRDHADRADIALAAMRTRFGHHHERKDSTR